MTGAVAVLQLVLGRDHWLNFLPPAAGSDERQGIGDYTFREFGFAELFRPTSSFLHSGKFGEIVCLSLWLIGCFVPQPRTKGGLVGERNECSSWPLFW